MIEIGVLVMTVYASSYDHDISNDDRAVDRRCSNP